MLHPRARRIQTIAAHLLAIGVLLVSVPRPVSAQEEAVVVYVLRHAERADDGVSDSVRAMTGDDPPLSEAGEERAREIAHLFAPVRLTHVHSTDYERTRATAEPVSRAQGLEIELYDAADIPAFARRLRGTPGTHLVVGHSNTNPALVEELGGDPGERIGALEYDRAYVLYLLPGGTGSAVFRFGAPGTAPARR